MNRSGLTETTAPRRLHPGVAPGASGYPRRFWWAWGGTLAGALVLVALVTSPPFLSPEVRSWVMAVFRFVCHQLPGRSPHIDGVPLAVCHRCYGIYSAVPVAVLGFLLMGAWSRALDRYAAYVLMASLLPLGIDWFGGVLGIWPTTPLSRLLTGGVFGLAAGYYLMQAVAHAVAASSVRTG